MLTLILSLVLCLPLVLGAPGWRVINGTEANKFEFKSIVSIWRNGQHTCGGTLVNGNTVLTAAHCFHTVSRWLWQIEVHVNAHNLQDPPKERQIVGVNRTISHPLWQLNGDPVYDFLLLKLNRSVPESDTVKYSPLPPSAFRIAKPGDECQVVGWGSTDPIGWPGSAKLMKGDMIVIPEAPCDAVFPGISDVHICAKSAYVSTTACKGDSGGPLFCKSGYDGKTYQVGVVSFGKVPCGQEGKPVVFARVTYEVNWIRSHMVTK